MAQQHNLFSDLLQTADYMKTFVFQRINSEEELRLRLEQAKANLSAAQRAFKESAEALKKSDYNSKSAIL